MAVSPMAAATALWVCRAFWLATAVCCCSAPRDAAAGSGRFVPAFGRKKLRMSSGRFDMRGTGGDARRQRQPNGVCALRQVDLPVLVRPAPTPINAKLLNCVRRWRKL